MGYPILQNQSAIPLQFLMVDSSDHRTGKTGLTPTVEIRKLGGSFATPAGAVSEVGHGWYEVAGDADDSDTLGPIILNAVAAGADPVDDRFEVIVYDPIAAATLAAMNATPPRTNVWLVLDSPADANITNLQLGPTGLDPALTGPADTFPGFVYQLWRLWFKHSTMTASSIQTYADDDVTIITTQSISDDGITQDIGAAT